AERPPGQIAEQPARLEPRAAGGRLDRGEREGLERLGRRGLAVLEARAEQLRARIAGGRIAHDPHGTVKCAVAQRFAIPITATAADIDELGHVSNLVYVRWVLDVAMAHSRSHGWDHPEFRAVGAVSVVRRREVD